MKSGAAHPSLDGPLSPYFVFVFCAFFLFSVSCPKPYVKRNGANPTNSGTISGFEVSTIPAWSCHLLMIGKGHCPWKTLTRPRDKARGPFETHATGSSPACYGWSSAKKSKVHETGALTLYSTVRYCMSWRCWCGSMASLFLFRAGCRGIWRQPAGGP